MNWFDYCEDLGLAPLDKKPKSPKKLKEVKTKKYIVLPDYDKWLSYDRKSVIPFTLNPADDSRLSPYSLLWYKLKANAKVLRVKTFFQKNVFHLTDYFIAIEISESGRLHFHGLMYIDKSTKMNLYNFNKFMDRLLESFSIRRYKNKWNNACFKGTWFNSIKNEDFSSAYNYVVKDIQTIFRSDFHIKWINHLDAHKIETRKKEVFDFKKLMNQDSDSD